MDINQRNTWNTESDTCLDAHFKKTEDLYLVFWYQLRECNQYAGEERHLAVILHAIPDESKSGIKEVSGHGLLQEHVRVPGGDEFDPIEGERDKIWQCNADDDKLQSLHCSP